MLCNANKSLASIAQVPDVQAQITSHHAQVLHKCMHKAPHNTCYFYLNI